MNLGSTRPIKELDGGNLVWIANLRLLLMFKDLLFFLLLLRRWLWVECEVSFNDGFNFVFEFFYIHDFCTEMRTHQGMQIIRGGLIVMVFVSMRI